MVIILKRTKKFLINGIILTLTTLLMRSISFIFNIYIAKKVGSEAIGVFGLVMSVYMFAITFATTGLSLACTYIVSERFAKRDYSCGIKTVNTCLFFSLLLGIGAMLISIIFSTPICNIWLKGQINSIPIYCMAIRTTFNCSFFCYWRFFYCNWKSF